MGDTLDLVPRRGVPSSHFPVVVGSGAQDAGHAEAAALLWALGWLIQAAADFSPRTSEAVIRFDAKAYGEATAIRIPRGSSWQCGRTSSGLTR